MPQLLESRRVRKHYAGRRVGLRFTRISIRAVDGVDLSMPEEVLTLGVVGESGSGKSTLARLLLGLERPTEGAVLFRGEHLNGSASLTRRFRREVKAVFQDPFGSLDPRMSIRHIIEEPLVTEGVPRAERETRVGEALLRVGLSPRLLSSLPQELSGGMRQRVAIARAIVTKPRLIVLDEPISALDVSIRAQILNLLCDIQDEKGISYILIGHDLPTMGFMCDEIMVMFAGQVVEKGPAEYVLSAPLHPYTRALVDSVLPDKPEVSFAQADFNDRVDAQIPREGCPFRNRCPSAMPACGEEVPVLKQVEPGHEVACHLY